MPYLKKTTYAGRTCEIEYTFVTRYKGKKIEPTMKQNPTPEDVKAYNDYQAERHLRQLINHNFKTGDTHMVLSYSKNPTPTEAEAKKHLTNFIRRLHTYAKKQGKILKYITATEWKHKRIHHHVIVNCDDLKTIQKIWGHGLVRATSLDDSGDYSALAMYIIKETKQDNKKNTRRYSASQSLIMPQPKVTVLKREPRNTPKAPKGYTLIKNSEDTGVCVVTDKIYMRARFIKQAYARGKPHIEQTKQGFAVECNYSYRRG